MTLASMDYKVVKSGSKAYTSLLGSSDFISIFVKDLKLSEKITDFHSVALDKYNFFYSHTTKCYPWIKNIDSIINFFGKELFDILFNEMDRNVLNAKIKIDGISSNNTISRLKHYKSYNYSKVMILHGMTNNKIFFG